MESGLRRAERVLVICTPAYVEKAEAGTDGVGYERMILTVDLVRNIATNKFIPIVRNALPEKRTPTFLATRLFIDMSDGHDPETRLDDISMSLDMRSAAAILVVGDEKPRNFGDQKRGSPWL